MMRTSPQIHPKPPTERRPRSAAACRVLELAREYDRARRALWEAGGVSFRARLRVAAPDSAFAAGDASDAALVGAARVADEGFKISRLVPGVGRELAAAKRARDAFASANFPLVGAFTSRRGQGQRDPRGLAMRVDPADLFQAGVVGLLAGVDRFDPDRDVAPSTFLMLYIGRAVRNAEYAAPVVPLTQHAVASQRAGEAVRSRRLAETGEHLSLDQTCAELGRPDTHAVVLAGVERALSAVVEVGGEAEIAEAIPDPDPLPDEVLVARERRSLVREVLESAPPGERAVLRALAGEGPGGRPPVAREAGCTRATVPAIRRRAIDSARSALARVT